MTFDPTTNRVPMYLLTDEEKKILMSAKHGWECYKDHYDKWGGCKQPMWIKSNIYRAKPAPRTVSTWVNIDVYPDGRPHPNGDFMFRKDVDECASPDRTHVIRLDLTDGVLTAHIEPTEYEDDI